MLTQHDELFSLIHSLTKTERRYFKLNFSKTANADVGKYMQVFDCLAQMKDFDKEALIAQVPGDLCSKYYSKTKAYLIDNILDSMMQFAKGGGQFQEQLLSELAAIHFLLRKHLTSLAKSKLAKLKKKCIESESILALLEVLALEMQIQSGHWEIIRPLNVLYDHYLDLLKHDVHVYNIHYAVIELELVCSVRPNAQQLQSIQSFLEDLDQYQDQELLMDTRRRLCSTQAICYYMQNQPQRAFHVLAQFIHEYSKQPLLYRSIRSESFSRILQNAFSFAYRTGDIGFYEQAAQQLRSALESSSCGENVRFELHLIEMFHRIALTGDYKHLDDSVQYVQKNQDRIQEISTVRRMDLMFNIALGYFKLGKTSQSIEWLCRLFSDPESQNFVATLRHARLLEILLHWKLQNTTLVLSRIRAFQRSLSQDTDLGTFEKAVLRFLNSVASKEKYSRFEKELLLFRKDLANLDSASYAGIVKHYDDLISFIQK